MFDKSKTQKLTLLTHPCFQGLASAPRREFAACLLVPGSLSFQEWRSEQALLPWVSLCLLSSVRCSAELASATQYLDSGQPARNMALFDSILRHEQMELAARQQRVLSSAHLEPLQLVLQLWYNREVVSLYDGFEAFCPFVLVKDLLASSCLACADFSHPALYFLLSLTAS